MKRIIRKPVKVAAACGNCSGSSSDKKSVAMVKC